MFFISQEESRHQLTLEKLEKSEDLIETPVDFSCLYSTPKNLLHIHSSLLRHSRQFIVMETKDLIVGLEDASTSNSLTFVGMGERGNLTSGYWSLNENATRLKSSKHGIFEMPKFYFVSSYRARRKLVAYLYRRKLRETLYGKVKIKKLHPDCIKFEWN